MKLWNRLRYLVHRRQFESELDEELRIHREMAEENLRREGAPPLEARHAASRVLGNVTLALEDSRAQWNFAWLETLLQDFRYALRTLRKAPGFTAVALLTLALGIGANTAIFSAVYGVLLRPLPYKDASRLVVLNETTQRVGAVSVSYLNFLDWRSQSHSFSEMAAVCDVGFNLAGITQPETIHGQAVSSNFLSLLGVRPLLGRDFTASEEKAGTAPVVLLSYPLWQSHFGGGRDVIGRAIRLDGNAVTIVGVLPPEFRSVDKTDVLEPIGVWVTNNSEAGARAERGDMVVVGRLAQSVRFAQARAEMDGIAARLAQAYPEANDQFGVALRPIRDVFVSEIRPAILVLFGAVMFVLLIACANVANLFLMRGAGRSKEIALRLAIGASCGRIIRQLLVESFVLAFFGGLFGLALAAGGIRAIAQVISMDALGGASVSLDGVVLAFAGGVVVLSAVIFGLAPAIHFSRADVHTELKAGSRTTGTRTGQSRWRGVLVVAEVSLALMLLVGAGLMMKSLYRLLSVDPGFRPARVLTMEMSLRTAQYNKAEAIRSFWQQALDRVRELPGVEAAALGTGVPLTNEHWRADIFVEGTALPKPGAFPHPDMHIVSADYMSALGMKLLRGRAFTEADGENAPSIAIVNAMTAQRLFPGEDPVGKRFIVGRPSTDKEWLTIVGVAGDTKLYGLANPSRLEVYIPFRQRTPGTMQLLVKSAIDPAALTSAIRQAIAAIDKDQPIFAIATMQQLVGDSVATRRITLILLGLFSALALVLAAIGIYGVISYSVAQRTHEIGIRMALGARRQDVLRMVLAQGMKIACAGVAIGIAASLGLTRLMANLLYAVSAADPSIFAAVALLILLIAVLACYIPARRTLRVDPVIAIRYE